MLKKITWVLFAFLAIGVGLYPSMYFFIDERFGLLIQKSDFLLNDTLWNLGFYSHIGFGGLALMVGWIQFSESIRKKYLKLHRSVGFVYMISVLISGVSGLYIALFAEGGLASIAGFLSLAIFWLYTTTSGFIAIKNKDIRRHQIMLIYSYAACFGAVTLRLWLPLLIMYFQGEFIPAYRIVAWLAWVPNIIVAYWIIKRYLPAPKTAAL